jgi:hypothetical protein
MSVDKSQSYNKRKSIELNFSKHQSDTPDVGKSVSGTRSSKRLSNSTVYDYQLQYKVPLTFTKKNSRASKNPPKNTLIRKECSLYVPDRKSSEVNRTWKYEKTFDIEEKFKALYNMSNIW